VIAIIYFEVEQASVMHALLVESEYE